MYKNFISWLMRKWVAASTVFRHRWFLPFIITEIYLGINCFCLHILLYQIAAFCFIQFSSDVFVLVGFVCLFGINKFNVYGSVDRKYIPIYIQQDETLHSLFISVNCGLA